MIIKPGNIRHIQMTAIQIDDLDEMQVHPFHPDMIDENLSRNER